MPGWDCAFGRCMTPRFSRLSDSKRSYLRLIRTVSISLAIFLWFTTPLVAKSRLPGPTANPDYVFDLATANDLLRAWQTQDGETGILLLTDRLKHRIAEDVLDSFFSPSGCQRQGFEIGHGKRLAPGRYQFPVSLFQKPGKTTLAKATFRSPRPQPSALVVVKTGNNDWAIDKLP